MGTRSIAGASMAESPSSTPPYSTVPDFAAAFLIAGRAPSAHNTQPWAPRVIDASTVELAAASGRALLHGDPTGRDLLLSLGCWVESFAIAMAEQGRKITVEALPALTPFTSITDAVAGPLLRLRVDRLSTPGDQLFTVAEVCERRVYRGHLDRLPWSPMQLPAGFSVREIDAQAMNRLVRLGAVHLATAPPIAQELIDWLRLSPSHPDYYRDGMTDRMIQLARPVAGIASVVVRIRWLCSAALSTAGFVGRGLRRLPGRPFGQATPLDSDIATPPSLLSAPSSARSGPTSSPQHVVLISDACVAGPALATGTPTRILLGGRHLQRLWLDIHRRGGVVAPHSEVIDSPHAHQQLRHILDLSHTESALAVFTVGRTSKDIPRSPRLVVDRSQHLVSGSDT